MRTIVIGDIHGCFAELKALFKKLIEGGLYNEPSDKIIFLGDYVDRGPDSRLVVEFIREFQERNSNVIALRGNHEEMLIACYFFADSHNSGLRQTLKSYEGYHDKLEDDVIWMRSLPLYAEDDYAVYVHAGIDPGLPMSEQNKEVLIWTRNSLLYSSRHKYAKKVIFGHTPTFTKTGEHLPIFASTGNINIDTGCVFGGNLTALILEDGEVIEYVQAPKKEE